jgi:hypothetical protein
VLPLLFLYNLRKFIKDYSYKLSWVSQLPSERVDLNLLVFLMKKPFEN